MWHVTQTGFAANIVILASAHICHISLCPSVSITALCYLIAYLHALTLRAELIFRFIASLLFLSQSAFSHTVMINQSE